MTNESKKPEYDQEFFLALATKGKDAWNAWRRDPANKDVHVTFKGVDFSEPPKDQIDFSGFEFGDEADFSGCKWRGAGWEETRYDPDGFAPGRASFADAAFGYGATFASAIFADRAIFSHAVFGVISNFAGAVFGYLADFSGADLGWEITFARVAFADRAIFACATFGALAKFTDATFGNRADFQNSRFEHTAEFSGTAFGENVTFENAFFGDEAKFSCTFFGRGANFAGTCFGKVADFNSAVFEGRVEFTGKSEQQWTSGQQEVDHVAVKFGGFLADRFLIISFANAHFYREAVFMGRSFGVTSNFTNTYFCVPPDFDSATNIARIDFTGARIGFATPDNWFHWTEDSQTPIRLRALRKIAEETKNHDLERDLYIEERKAERGVYLRQRWDALKKEGWKNWPRNLGKLLSHVLWIVVMALYWALADYGRSFLRPLVWLFASVFFFDWRYTNVLGPLMEKAPDVERYKQALGMLANGNAVPFVGPLTIDTKIKEFLLCPNNANSCLPPIPPEGFQFLVLAQNLFSITCAFFIGLALRNYFKIK